MTTRENPTSTALIILPCITGSISIFFSSLLIIRLIRHRSTLLKKVKERLILGLCFMDIIFSTACIMSTFAGPTYLLEEPTREEYAHFHMRGSRATCNLQGWLYHLGSGAPMYNAALCFYYYLYICRGVRDDKIQKWIEPLMHAIIWTWPLMNAFIAVGLNFVWFGGYFGCVLTNPRPWDRCTTLNPNLPDCQGTHNPDLILFVVSLAPNIAAIFSIIVFISLIYRKVRKTEVQGKQWSFDNVLHRLRNANDGDSSRPIVEQQQEQQDEENDDDDEEQQQQHVKEEEEQKESISTEMKRTSCTEERDSSIILNNATDSSRQLRRQQQEQTTRYNGDEENGQRDSLQFSFQRASSSVSSRPALSNAVSETGIQYVLALVISYTPATLLLVLSRDDAEYSVTLSFMTAMTFPLQGLWNWLIYTRGRLKVLREQQQQRIGGGGNATNHDNMTCWNSQWWYTVFFE